MLNPWNGPLMARVMCKFKFEEPKNQRTENHRRYFGSSVLWFFDFSLVHFSYVLEINRLVSNLDFVRSLVVVFRIDFDGDTIDLASHIGAVAAQRGDRLADEG